MLAFDRISIPCFPTTRLIAIQPCSSLSFLLNRIAASQAEQWRMLFCIVWYRYIHRSSLHLRNHESLPQLAELLDILIRIFVRLQLCLIERPGSIQGQASIIKKPLRKTLWWEELLFTQPGFKVPRFGIQMKPDLYFLYCLQTLP